MPTLKFYQRTLTSDHSGRVFFCMHPNDTDRAQSIIDEVLSISDCIACVDSYPQEDGGEEWLSLLSDMQLFVVLVSKKFLKEKSRARDEEIPLAQKLHVPILPILVESVSLEDYNKVFPDIQYLDPKDKSDAALPYRQKLERALGEVLQNSSTRAKIRDSFDLSFFLSYRKKDRRWAQALLEKIHSKEQFQSVAIWYDEFLRPGEDFNHSIEEAMDSSSLFLMSVTPNMLEPTNYVLDVEFPAAVEKDMQIIAVETQTTSSSEFSDKFKKAPPLISIKDEEKLFSALVKITNDSTQKEYTAERTYYLGLAYLNGIAVEVNRPLGVKLIKESADKNCSLAIQKLINMYRCGDGVERNYREVISLQEKLIKILFEEFKARHDAESFDNYLNALLRLAEEYKNLGDYDSAKEVLIKTKTEADRLRDANHLSSTGHLYMRIATERWASVERLAGNLDEAIMILKSNLPYFRFELEESGSDNDKQALAVLLQELANLYAEKGNMKKSQKYADEAMALNEELVQKATVSALDKYNLGVNLFNKAITLSGSSDQEGARECCFRAMDILSGAMDHRESCSLYVRTHLLLGEIYEKEDRKSDATSAYAKAIDICESPSTPQDIVILKLKAEAITDLGKVVLSSGNHIGARSHLRRADELYEELIAQYDEKKLYRRRAEIAFIDAQICYMQCLMGGAQYNYEKCIEYMETYTEDKASPKDMHILALASYLLGAMNRSSPDVERLQKAFTIWSELAEGEGGEPYAQYRDEVASMLVKLMF